MEFDLPTERSSIIKVLGIGGGGNNAVNHMFRQGITGVNFVICNTDAQALEDSPIPVKVHLGPSLTEGRGAGNDPSKGKEATEESLDDIRSILEINTKMLFITAGMGGGTGTGGAAVIAKLAREMGILTVGIVTRPFSFEGNQRINQAEEGLSELRREVDTLIVVSNDKLRVIHGDLTLKNAFGQADDVLSTAAKGIAEIITVSGYVNVDFEDVRTVMQDSGVAIMGMGSASGDERALEAVMEAINSPLLDDNDIGGAKKVLINIISGEDEVRMDEITEITNYVQDQAGNHANVIWGNCQDESIGDRLIVTVIATGFDTTAERKIRGSKKETKILPLDEKFETEDQQETLDGQAQLFETSEEKSDQTKEVIFDFGHSSNQEKKEEQGEEENHLDFLDEPQVEEKIEMTAEEDEREKERLDVLKKNQERLKKLRSMSSNLNPTANLQELESQPAYVRRNVQLDDVPHSSEKSMSKLSLDESSESSTEGDSGLNRNNSFLHDNVD